VSFDNGMVHLHHTGEVRTSLELAPPLSRLTALRKEAEMADNQTKRYGRLVEQTGN
jgi:hypothetical protein